MQSGWRFAQLLPKNQTSGVEGLGDFMAKAAIVTGAATEGKNT
jgi:hypothetical protein